jgi:hypothetical protein
VAAVARLALVAMAVLAELAEPVPVLPTFLVRAEELAEELAEDSRLARKAEMHRAVQAAVQPVLLGRLEPPAMPELLAGLAVQVAELF